MNLFLLLCASVVVLFAVFIGATLFRSGVMLLCARPESIRDAQYHSPKSALKVIRGEVDAYRSDGSRDSSVAAGIAIDKRNGVLMLQGRVSDEVLEGLIRS